MAKQPSIFVRAYDKAIGAWQYFNEGVWELPHDTLWSRIVKTANLSMRSFLDRGLQQKSMALTYSTVLAIVPAFALVFAIGRGFGFQNLLQDELYSFFPAQRQAIGTALSFVDSYLSEASKGVFVGVGLIVLLWTLISLLSGIEETFNSIWDIKKNRSMAQKFTDYIAICLLVPILMICSSGISIFMSTTLQSGLHIFLLTPFINTILEATPLLLAWMAFATSFCLIPNTKVSFKYSAISGAICAIIFQILQLLFVNGQIYVSKYNAIYGSFAFLPLLLIWLQLSWLILLFGCVLTYSMQNVFAFNFLGDMSRISHDYMRKITVIVMAVILRRFEDGGRPYTRNDISTAYDLPIRLVSRVLDRLKACGFVYEVLEDHNETGFAPAVDNDKLTVGELFERIDTQGRKNFIPRFDTIYAPLVRNLDEIFGESYRKASQTLVRDLPLPTAADIKAVESTP